MLNESVHQLDCKCLSCAEERDMLTDKQQEQSDKSMLELSNKVHDFDIACTCDVCMDELPF